MLANIPISVSHNLKRLRNAIRSLVPGAHIFIDSIESSIVVEGTVDSASQAEAIVRMA